MASLHRDPSRPNQPWVVRWRERGRHRTRRFSTRGDGQRFIADLLRGRRPSTTRFTVEQWLEQWLETRGLEWEAKTERDRAWFCDKYVVPYLGGVRLDELARPDVRAWRRELTRVTTVKQANRAVRTLSAALGAAVEDDILGANPCQGLRPLVEEPSDRRPATIVEVEAIRSALTDPADLAVVSLMAYAGLRPGEARVIQWTDIGPLALEVRRGERATGRTKTGAVRSVPISDVLRQDLEFARALAGDRPTVHKGTSGGNWRNRVWHPACRSAGVEGVTPYSLRHTAASLWVAEGRSVREVADLLGHSMQMTMATYAHLFHEQQLRRGEGVADAAARARREAQGHHD